MWDPQDIPELKSKYLFIMVTNTEFFGSRVTIDDAHNIWMENPNIIFNVALRISGTEEDILEHLGDEEIEDSENTITFYNYSSPTISLIFREELENYRYWKVSVLKKNLSSGGYDLIDLIQNINPNLEVEKASTVRSRAKPLQEKLNNLPDGKLLNVSKINTDQTGVVTIDASRVGRLVGTERLRIVSSDFKHYLLAIGFLDGGNQKYSEDIMFVKSRFEGRRAIQPQIMKQQVRTEEYRPTFEAPQEVGREQEFTDITPKYQISGEQGSGEYNPTFEALQSERKREFIDIIPTYQISKQEVERRNQLKLKRKENAKKFSKLK